MTQQEINEGNKLIAEFMGAILHKKWTSEIYTIPSDTFEFKIRPTINSSALWEYGTLQYHLSWDWLKPVVDKIYTYVLVYQTEVIHVSDLSIVVDIEPCWRRVVDFIKFYNELNK